MGDDGAPGHARNARMQHEYEHKTANDVDDVEDDGDPHGRLGVLHADKPSFEHIKRQVGRCCPDADVEVGEG